MKQKINSTVNRIRLNKVQRVLKKVNVYCEQFQLCSDIELQAKTESFKVMLSEGKMTLDQLLPEAYAVVREASRRVLGMYPKDVQVMGAIVLHQGNIAEMQTGEGKTLTATMPLYLNALTGKGAYLITTNDYLAKRDFLEMQPLYEWLGLSSSLGFVDIVDYEYGPGEKRAIFNHDIIYTTNGRLGFDYLIDNLADNLENKFLPDLNFAIIDEVDSIILDAAQTPLVISGAPRVQSNLFHIVKRFVETMDEQDFKLDKSKKEVWLTDKGIQAANKYFNVSNIYDEPYFDLVRNINLAIRAQHLFDINLDYFIQNGEIILIDRITGRMLPGTKMQAGLHQAVEAKEDVEISKDLSVMATITFQNLFKQFENFSGMTATGKLGEEEFFDLYSKIVVQVPTDKPIQRIDYADKVFINVEDKNSAILDAVVSYHNEKRPVLLITRTAEAAEAFSAALFQMDIPNNLLIAQNVAKEAQMIAEAGYLSAVTVATSMAGRGTDIKLDQGVHELGGLAVIISEHMENSRVDRQLRGRAGRQGDPGSSQIYISLDDYLVQRWGDGKLKNNQRLNDYDSNSLENSRVFQHRVKHSVNKAQRVSEEQGVRMREMANEYEKSISIQRELVYAERDRILEMVQSDDFNLDRLAQDVFEYALKKEIQLTKDGLIHYIYNNISFKFEDKMTNLQTESKEAAIQSLMHQFHEQMAENKQKLKNDYFYLNFVRKAILKAVDSGWIDQVDNLQQLKASVGNRQNGQRNAIFEYHKVALDAYDQMIIKIKRNMIRNLCQSMITYDEYDDLVIHFP